MVVRIQQQVDAFISANDHDVGEKKKLEREKNSQQRRQYLVSLS